MAPSPKRARKGPSLASDRFSVSDAAAASGLARPWLRSGTLLLASDFDGTLSRLVADPWSARIVPMAQRALRRLAAAPRVHVALISGRTVDDLATRARIGGISYRGDHGSERAEARRGFRPAALRVQRETVSPIEQAMADRLAAELPALVPEPWLVVEHKGAAVTFHFRAAPDVADARARVVEAVGRVDAGGVLRRTGSPRAVELRPVGAPDKGDALRGLLEERRPAATIMLGDDRNDALAFRVLREARRDGVTDGLAIAVAGHADVTREVAPQADLVLPSPDEVARFLRDLAREASPPTRGASAQTGA